MFFWNSCAFSMIQWMLAIWSLVPLPFLNQAWTSGSSWFTYYWSLAWRILSNTLLACEWVQLCGSLNILWHWLSWGLEWKLPFSSPVATAEFSKFAGILSAALSQHHLLEFGIPSPPLALFIMMLPKAHLSSHSRMSGSRPVTTPSWLFRSLRSSFYSSSVFLSPFSIFCFFSVHTISVLYCGHLCMKCSFGISNFLEDISNLSHSIVFLYLFALITEEGKTAGLSS